MLARAIAVGRVFVVVWWVVAGPMVRPSWAQNPGVEPGVDPPRPPAPIGSPLPSSPPAGELAPPSSVLPHGPAAGPPTGFQPAPTIPPGHAALMLGARYGPNQPAINAGLHWWVYADKPDQNGGFRLFKEDRSAAPTFVLPGGGYVVAVSFGLASAVRRVQLGSDPVRQTFELPAGGVRFEGRVGDSRVPAGQISFDVYRGSQFEPGEKRPVAQDIGTGELVLLPEGVYHVVSKYGDGNALVRSDIRVQTAKLTDVTINHRAAVITLKLVSERGGEAVANTAWSVLTPAGDVIKESIGAFPKVILEEGDYVAIARNEGKVYNQTFKVEAGLDREIEVLAR